MALEAQVEAKLRAEAEAKAKLQTEAEKNVKSDDAELKVKADAGGKGKGQDRDMKVTKAMTRVLRHSAVEQGLAIRVDGFLDVQELLSERRVQALGVTEDEAIEAVHSNDKKRFELLHEGTQVSIRAIQGHSMRHVEDEQLLTPLDQADPWLPTVCVHGTYRRHAESILQQGLLAGGGKSQRKHVHFAPFEPGDKEVVSGMRYDCDTAIYLDLRRALRAGLPFFKSSNNVILSPGIGGVIAPEYISQVKHWQHGELVSENKVSDTVNAFSPGESGAASRGSGMMIFAPENNDVVIGAAAASASFVASIIDDDAIACGQSGSDEQSDVPNSVVQQMFAMAKHNPSLERRKDTYDCLRALTLAVHDTELASAAQTAVAALENQSNYVGRLPSEFVCLLP